MNKQTDLEEKIEKLEKKLRRVGGQLDEVGDIFSPSAQRDFRAYKGTFSQYMREQELRKKATGRNRTFFNIAAALTGNEDISRIISEKFDEKYSEAEVEQAKQALRDEFGIKESENKKDKEEVFKETLETFFNPITQTVNGLVRAADKTAEEIKDVYAKLSTISNSLVPTINQLATALAGGTPSARSVAEKLKPITVTGLEGEEYLYYPDAPEGRQLYEKSKKGTAGRIASKKTQKSLKSEIKRLMNENSMKPIRKIDLDEVAQKDPSAGKLLGEIKKLLDEQTAYRKEEMANLLSDLKLAVGADNGSSIFTAEPDEQQSTLQKALTKALEEIIAENPDLLKCQSSLLGDIGIPNLRGNLFGKNGPINPSTVPKFAPGVGGVGGFAAAPILSGLAATAATAFSFDSGMKSIGEGAIGKIANSSAADIAVALERGYNKEYTRQRLHEMAKDNPELQVKLKQAEQMAGLIKPEAKPQNATALVIERNTEPMGQQIIDQNRKKLEINNAQEVTIPSQTVNQYNTTSVIPIPAKEKSISVNNPDNTFNRLLAQEFNHPSTYSSLTMG